MKLTIEEVEHIAALARLELSEDEKQRYAEQLSDILDYAARLDELATDQIPPTASVLDMQLRLREDQSRPGLSQEDVLKNAADAQDEQFKVPPVFGGQE
jgi:aspartyl-tRNA(Asn)/glutamyl-tRNA(Gln) amidotransferase subunit C